MKRVLALFFSCWLFLRLFLLVSRLCLHFVFLFLSLFLRLRACEVALGLFLVCFACACQRLACEFCLFFFLFGLLTFWLGPGLSCFFWLAFCL